MQLLAEAVDEAIGDAADDVAAAAGERERDALRLVDYKLHQLRGHVSHCSRLLNDLRTLRRLLLHERVAATTNVE